MNLLFERRAEIALRSLRGQEQKQAQRALYEIQNIDSADILIHHKTHKLVSPSGEPLYTYRVGKRLRFVLQIAGENCRIIDVVDHNRLSHFVQDRGQQ